MTDNYTNVMIKQFGGIQVFADTPCKLCGKRYGDHLGLTCPPKNGIFLKPNKEILITKRG